MTTQAIDADLRMFASDPIIYFGYSRRAMHTLPPAELAELQLAALRMRFADLRDRLPVLATMADEQGIRGLGGLDAAAPLLFPHTVYKSYPASLLREARFDALTTWLSRLTTVQLDQMLDHRDIAACDSIDRWLELLDTATPLRLAHSSGTSGTMSFFPHSAGQFEKLYEIVRLEILPDRDPGGVDVVWPGFAVGRSGIARHATAMASQIAGTPERFHPLHPGLLSADVMYLAGRLRAAARHGELDRVEISPALRERRAEFEEAQRATGQGMASYVEYLADTLSGRRVVSLSLWDVYYGMARAGLDRGLSGVFAADSVIFPGGGTKGGVLPSGWAEQVAGFAGVPALRFCYAMTEVIALNLLCGSMRYHIEPWVVLYVLDPQTGMPLPREGRQTGRAAFFDLTADLYWGGSVSGDEITVDWRSCPCGRSTPQVTMDIGRFGDRGATTRSTARPVTTR